MTETVYAMPPKKKVMFPCGNCGKTVGSGSLQCNICDFWHHKNCIPGMTDAFLDTLLTMKEAMGSTCWICEKCTHATKKLHKDVVGIAKRMDKVEGDVKANKSAVDSNKVEIEQLKARLLKVESNNGEKDEGTKSAVIAELQQLDNRRNNAVIYGLSESDSTDAETRKNKDLDLIRSIAIVMNLNLDKWLATISTVRRMGRVEPSKSRPLLVCFTDPEARDALLNNARFLARSEMDHVSIKPDLTKAQQDADVKLREEAKKLNLEKPHDERGHFLWKVIGRPGQPSRRLIKNYLPLQGPNNTPIHEPRRALTHPASAQTPPAVTNTEDENNGWSTARSNNRSSQRKRTSSSQQPGSPNSTPLTNKPRHTSPKTNHPNSVAVERNELSPGRDFQILDQEEILEETD